MNTWTINSLAEMLVWEHFGVISKGGTRNQDYGIPPLCPPELLQAIAIGKAGLLLTILEKVSCSVRKVELIPCFYRVILKMEHHSMCVDHKHFAKTTPFCE